MVEPIEQRQIKMPCPILDNGPEATLYAQFHKDFDPAKHNPKYISWIERGKISQYHLTASFNCESCALCKPIRINANNFSPSRSQKRIINKNKDLTFSIGPAHIGTEGFGLYQRYMKDRHPSSDMNDVSLTEFHEKISTGDKLATLRQGEKLVAYSLLKVSQDGVVTEYTAFDPTLKMRSLGTFMDLKSIEYAQANNIPFIYLGSTNTQSDNLKHKVRLSGAEIFSNVTKSWHPIERGVTSLDHIP